MHTSIQRFSQEGENILFKYKEWKTANHLSNMQQCNSVHCSDGLRRGYTNEGKQGKHWQSNWTGSSLHSKKQGCTIHAVAKSHGTAESFTWKASLAWDRNLDAFSAYMKQPKMYWVSPSSLNFGRSLVSHGWESVEWIVGRLSQLLLCKILQCS